MSKGVKNVRNSRKIDIALLDKVIKNTVEAVERSKSQIFEIAEMARKEEEALYQKLQQVEAEVRHVIREVDRLEVQYRISRQRLAEVSRYFNTYTEEDIRKAYESANEKQLNLFVAREREANLRHQRDELQQRLKNIAKTIERADSLAAQVGVVLDFLTGDLNQLGAELEKAQHRQMIGLKIIQAQEEERKRVAREIHDGPAQMMAHVVMLSEIAERLLQKDVEQARRELHDLKETVRSSLSEVRKIIFDLRPMVLDDLGLLPTLRKYLENFKQRYSVMYELIILGKEKRLAPPMEVALFRLIQEALSNVGKHAKASEVVVRLEFQPRGVTVSIRDDGVGFEYPPEEQSENQFGLIGMRERVEMLEGKMEIRTSLGAGTHVKFNIPMDGGKHHAG